MENALFCDMCLHKTVFCGTLFLRHKYILGSREDVFLFRQKRMLCFDILLWARSKLVSQQLELRVFRCVALGYALFYFWEAVMEDYKEMYYALFNTFTEVTENLDAANYGIAKALLINAQQKAEDISIDSADKLPQE